MCPSVQKFLRFVINHLTYQFTCLPFGLATSPQDFTQLLRPVVQLLCLKGIGLHVYLDDWFIQVDLPDQVSSRAQLVVRVLHHLGWLLNHDKSELKPTTNKISISLACTFGYKILQLPPTENEHSGSLEMGPIHISWGHAQNDPEPYSTWLHWYPMASYISTQCSGGHSSHGTKLQRTSPSASRFQGGFYTNCLGGLPQ